MYYPVEWSSRALNDLDYIYTSVSEHAPRTANRLLERILNRTEQLHNNPRSGQLEPELLDEPEELRYLVCEDYKIIYAVYEKDISIFTIFDTRQDPSKLRVR